MKIVVLDGYTLNPGDLSWEGLAPLGEYTVYDRSASEQIVERAHGAEMILINKVVLSRQMLEQMPGLQYIGVLATGYNIVDLQATSDLGIVVTNVPSYGTSTVAQMVFAHLLNLCQQVAYHHRTVIRGRWSHNPDFCYWDFPLMELDGKTMGIVGYGQIGRAVAKLALAFGMQVLITHRRPLPEMEDGVRQTDLETLFTQSDVVSLHCPLTKTTHHLVDQTTLRWMKPSAFLINTSRGPLIDELALAEALNRGELAGAGLDVLEQEPPPPDSPLFAAKNCFITPHIAWASHEARQRLMNIAVDNVVAFLNGNPQNVVHG